MTKITAVQTPISPWLPRVIRFLGVMFLVFFGSAFIGVLTGVDQALMRTEWGHTLMRLLRWGHGGAAYELMISVIYIVWGAFLWRAAADPLRHKMFLDFTVVANIAHFGLMALQGVFMPGEHVHLVGDVPLGWGGLILLMIFWLPARSRADGGF